MNGIGIRIFISALEIFLVMRYINLLFTYLLAYLLPLAEQKLVEKQPRQSNSKYNFMQYV